MQNIARILILLLQYRIAVIIYSNQFIGSLKYDEVKVLSLFSIFGNGDRNN